MTLPTPSTGLPTDGTHAVASMPRRATWRSRPLQRVLRRLLTNVRCGTLTVELPGGERAEGRGTEPGPHGTLVLHRWRPLWRLAVGGDLGLAESYRQGEWSSPDLAALLELGVRNEAGWGRALQASLPARLLARLFHLRRANTRRGSRQNISFHYDMGNDFYAQWLDPDMLYSSAIYGTGQESLEQAQQAKLARIATLLAPRAGERVLEIGCGWGALAIALARDTGASVTGLTLSSEQLRHARQRVHEEALTEHIDLRLQDYRDVEGQFDHIVSIEMLEAVGERYWPAYFQTLKERLRPGGRAVVQVITIADAQFEQYRSTTDFIQRYIFPGGMLPSPSRLRQALANAGLALQAAETFGPSYATTLAEWRHRFLSTWPTIEPLGFDAPFRRLWEYYLCYCEAGFSTGRVDVGLYTIVHAPPAAPDTPDTPHRPG
ncbi:cyclopropane-fatty-acyl-phospholipid synthase family protein [Acidovorax sp. SUPP2522]|uniref:SAM-dependent methyltransferase n=1 Tax=unclassified Acidovorax TaxID=2684926 RepID=UPI00234B7474|nr:MULTISPECIES: cyclopropane-fatty-acyl-phospholipid synthase family protein [unclassified Acidovorax]WCM96590.1 cyclopropane-fatty-acyl-phospholipid synthase family protein [Acidovorax sp. GBBC 1281]GKT17902.1 cyclopropane-fatty-acyl-phospholipid synthase family protein [Acidovorax sp. SUPP2522]